MINKIIDAAKFVKSQLKEQVEFGLILGTGLNDLADLVEDPVIIPYEKISNMPISTAPSHQGRLVAGYLSGKYVIIMQGRVHYYEGYTMDQVTYPVRLLIQLGIKNLILTNAAGSLNEEFQPGDVIALEDHINFMGTNPLIGENYSQLGERFPSMNEPYDQKLRQKAFDIARENHISLKSGVYLAVSGPSLETRAECLMFKQMGADLVGMSTVPETIIGVHGGIKVMGFSVVTNMSNIFHGQAHSQEEIWINARNARAKLETVIRNLIK